MSLLINLTANHIVSVLSSTPFIFASRLLGAHVHVLGQLIRLVRAWLGTALAEAGASAITLATAISAQLVHIGLLICSNRLCRIKSTIRSPKLKIKIRI